MSEKRKTVTLSIVALLFSAVLLLTAPRRVAPDAFFDRGEVFFPDFEDPNSAITLEVIDFDEETAAAKPFKVTVREGQWTIPSHHDYPADGKDRLARTAAGVIGIRKDDFRSANVTDHEACGVIDPLDEAVTSLKGRGKRVTIRGAGDQTLADLIIGKQLEDRENMYFVRVPGQKRVYVSRIDIDISTKFEDWIEKDLLQVEKDKIQKVLLRDYSINERTGRIEDRDTLELSRDNEGWKANRMTAGQEVNSSKMDDLLRAIDELAIVGVRPKPQGLSASLRKAEDGVSISQPDLLSLQSRGYYFTRDGNLVSNEGELEVTTQAGVTHTLRFGEILYGSGEAITAGSESLNEGKSGPGENRYLFITAEFNQGLLKEPPRPANLDFQGKAEEELTDQEKRNRDLDRAHKEWEESAARGREQAEQLNNRFADWYYVISSSSFDKIKVKRSDILSKKQP